jgi:hypothetical protein
LRASHTTTSKTSESAGMAAALSTELEGKVPDELVAEIVRAVLDETRKATKDQVIELTMGEARKRLERFIRARSTD